MFDFLKKMFAKKEEETVSSAEYSDNLETKTERDFSAEKEAGKKIRAVRAEERLRKALLKKEQEDSKRRQLVLESSKTGVFPADARAGEYDDCLDQIARGVKVRRKAARKAQDENSNNVVSGTVQADILADAMRAGEVEGSVTPDKAKAAIKKRILEKGVEHS